LSVAGHEIRTSSGAHLTTSGTWTNASSREYKEAISPLSADAADKTLAALEPVTFRYKNDAEQQLCARLSPRLTGSPPDR
jgi:hypothetical protein